MTYRIKVPAKTLPVDEAHLLSGLEHALHRLQDYRRPILVGIGVFVFAAIVVGAVLWFDQQAVHKAQELYREATLHVMAIPGSDPAKAEASLKEAIAKYRQVADQYPRTPTAALALFQAGNALVQANDLGGAIDVYQRFIAMYGSNPGFVGLAQQRLAYIYLLKGDREQAVKVLTSVLELPGALNRDQVLFELGKLEESQSRPEGALAHYQELVKTHKNSPFASEAMIRTKILDVQKAPDTPAASPPAAQTPTGPPSPGTKKP
jgi:tetratricopeptide (TPR) repeat protein